MKSLFKPLIILLTLPVFAIALPDRVLSLFTGDAAQLARHWRGAGEAAPPASWTVTEDGVLHTDGSKQGDLFCKESFADFDLTFDWKISKGGNSGVFFRAGTNEKIPGKASGLEIQLVDRANYDRDIGPRRGAGSLYEFYEPDPESVKPHGEWNTTRVVARGKSIKVWLNDVPVCDTTIGGEDWNQRLAEGKFAKQAPDIGSQMSGPIALQDHGDEAWFRNIRLRKLE